MVPISRDVAHPCILDQVKRASAVPADDDCVDIGAVSSVFPVARRSSADHGQREVELRGYIPLSCCSLAERATGWQLKRFW